MYASEVWSPHTTKYKLQIENVQRRATKFILRYPKEKNYNQTLISLSILQLEYRREIVDLILLFKSKLGQSDINHSKRFQQMPHNRYNTRNFDHDNYRVNLIKQDYLKYFYFNMVVLLWNKLPKYYKSVTSLNLFKNKLLHLYRHKLETEYVFPSTI